MRKRGSERSRKVGSNRRFSNRMPRTFSEKALAIVRRIPRGKVMTYAEVARRAGSPRAARAVGTLMKRNFDPSVPCHRVIRSDGSLGGYNRGGTAAKRRLLRAEGARE